MALFEHTKMGAKPSVGLQAVNFTKIQFWVQSHELGLEKFIGEFIETEGRIEDINRNYMRLKVLLAGFWRKNSHRVKTLANIKYERLSDFCYGCGRPGHTTQLCKEALRMS